METHFRYRMPRRQIWLWRWAVLSVAGLALVASLGGAVGAPAVSSDRWLADVRYLASDELKGRGNGTPELDRAADYIAAQFREAGIKPVGADYFQPFEAVVGGDLGPNNRLALRNPDAVSYRPNRDFIPLGFSASSEQEGMLAFVGYGITAPEYNYDDYAGIDVTGKIVLVLRHEPQEEDAKSVFRGKQTTRHAALVSKAINARNHGAVAMLLVNDPVNHSGDQLIPFGSMGGPSNIGIPVLQVKQSVAGSWMTRAGKSLGELQKVIDSNLSNQSFVLPSNLQLQVKTDVRQRRRQVKNVVGFLPGNDPVLKQEVIVLGAHYDHLGLGEQDSLSPGQVGQIHHGADDNASGTAGLIELARLFSAEQPQLRRSLLFMAFAGEELGLLGSAHYVEEPLLPLSRTIAMINLDMIGRVRNRKLYVGGVGTSPGFRQLIEQKNQEFSFQLDFSDSGYDASDHMSFTRKQVPVLFFFSGLHGDYHKPSDTWDKQEPEETARVLELVRRIAWHIDAAGERPEFVAVRRDRPSARAEEGEERGYGPYFGSIPDFGETAQGVRFADVQEGSPAAKAGLQAGDVLIRFDGKDVQNLYDFTYLLRGKNPGDDVSVVVLRSEKEIRAVVKLARRE
ncbi:MAG: M28 family peptidase [Acidobacteria bacterium]|nr:M28 family peptidase [Acidobacteriota bacterium]